MRRVEQEVEINAPVEAVFDHVSNFSEFPRWLGGVERVRPLAPHRTRWTAAPPTGEAVEWEVETTAFEPDRRVAWRAVGGAPIEGEAVLEETSHRTTRLRLRLGCDEAAPPAVTACLFGDEPQSHLAESLARFKQIIESTGGWPRPVAAPTFLTGPTEPIRRARPLEPEPENGPRATDAESADHTPAVVAPSGSGAVRRADNEGSSAGGAGGYVYLRRQPVAGYVALALLGVLVAGLIASLVNWRRGERPTAQAVTPSPDATRRAPLGSATPTPAPTPEFVGEPTVTPTQTPSPTPSPSPTITPSAAANPDPDDPPPPPPTDAASRQAVAETLERWVAATNTRDVRGQMSFYAPVLDRYYRQAGVPRADVRADKRARFVGADAVRITAGDPEITFEDEGQRARVRFRKQYEIEAGGQAERGEVLQELILARQGDGWKIVSERDLRVIR